MRVCLYVYVCVCVCVGVLTSLSARYFLHICHDVCSFIRIHQWQKWNVLQTAAGKQGCCNHLNLFKCIRNALALPPPLSLSLCPYGIADYIWVSWKSISIILQFNFSVYFYILFTRLTRAPYWCVALAIFACLCNEARTTNKTRRHFAAITFHKGAARGRGSLFGMAKNMPATWSRPNVAGNTWSLLASGLAGSEAFSLLFK